MSKELTFISVFKNCSSSYTEERLERYSGVVWDYLYELQRRNQSGKSPKREDWRPADYVKLALACKLRGRRFGIFLALVRKVEQLKAEGKFPQARRLADEAWKMVERLDFSDLQDRHPALVELVKQRNKRFTPWEGELEPIPGHVVRLSEIDPEQVCFYRDGMKFMEGRQARTSPGKYLAEFYPELSAKEVKDLVWRMSPLDIGRVVFLTEADDWVRAYDYRNMSANAGVESNPYCSCMRGNDAVRVYAYPGNGLSLATLWAGEPFESTLLMRCIVREYEKGKGYLRPYANKDEDISVEDVAGMFKNAGYEWCNLNGAKVCREEYGYGCFVMPYIDSGNSGEQCCSDEVTYLRLGGGPIECTNTDGTSSRVGTACDWCGAMHDEDDMTWMEGVGYACPDCLAEHFVEALTSWRYGYFEWARRDNAVWDESTSDWISESIVDERGGYCWHCGNYHSDIDDLTEYVDSYGDLERTCCTHRLEQLDFAEQSTGYELTLVSQEDAVRVQVRVQVRDGLWAYRGDCVEVGGVWYLGEEHPDFDAELDTPEVGELSPELAARSPELDAVGRISLDA